MLALPGATLLCGFWEFLEIRRRKVRSRKFDEEAHSAILGSEIGTGYVNDSAIMELMTPFIDANGSARRAFLNIVRPLNEMADYRIWQPVLVCYPDTELVIEPARSGDA